MNARTVRGSLTGLAAIALLVTAGCSSDASSEPATGTEATSASEVAEIAALVPEDVREAGVLRVGTSAAYPPVSFLDDSGEFVGSDADLARAVGGVLGLKVEFENVPFDSVLAGILADRFDAAWSVMSVTNDRMEQVDFVSYLSTGTQALIFAGNPDNISDEESLCGLSLGVVKGSTQDIIAVPNLSAACEEAGLEPIDKVVYPGQAESNQALVAGRVSATMDVGTVLVWQEQQNPDVFEVHDGFMIDPAFQGAPVSKDKPELGVAIREATQHLIDNGEYLKILEQWNLEMGAIDEAVLNPEV